MARVLVIDDEENIRKTLTEILADEGHEIIVAQDGDRGLAALADMPDVVLLDLQLPRKDGLVVLQEIKDRKALCEVIVISGHGTIESAVKAIKLGAYHFLQKPLAMIEVKQTVKHASETKLQRDELLSWRSNEENRYQMIGKSAALERVRQQVQKVGPSAGRVLITGESGTGKEVIAYWIHRFSNRSIGPFIKINCAAIPQNLIESELFGHEKGAFTGALGQKKGKFEMAHGGTILLDEIGDMDAATQTKVLRVIQEGEFERVGGEKTIRVDVRVLAATHRNLQKMIEEGRFREDLYYRLNVIPIQIPSLSERIEDIPLLAQHFLLCFCRENGGQPRRFSPDALAFLAGQKYPGNIRQLKNIVERLAILSDSVEIGVPAAGAMVETKSDVLAELVMRGRPLQQAQSELECAYVKTQLELNGWNIAKTAEILGIQRTNLHRKIKQLGIERK